MEKESLIKVDIKEEQNHTIKLRVQNICCAKEGNLIKDHLKNVSGINTVFVNVIGRTAFINHDENTITSTEIIERLNKLHLGISLMEKGQQNENNKTSKYKLYLTISTFICLTILFIIVVAASIKNFSWTKWVAIAVYVIGSLPMLYKALLDMKRCILANVNLLMFIAVVGTIGLKRWLDGCIIVYVFFIASLLERLCRYKVEKDVGELMLSSPETAILADTNESVPVEEVKIGTLILICAGDKIPLDGEIIAGRAAVDESSLTGESTPVYKEKGGQVFGGSLVQSGYLKVQTTCDADSSAISKVSQLMQEAQAKSSKSEESINKFAKFYTPLVLIASFFIFIIPFIIYKVDKDKLSYAQLEQWGERALIVLVVSCPCSIIMAAPIPMISGITNAARNGALIKGSMHLETLSLINIVAFDKTGTLTEGKFQVIKEYATRPQQRDEAVRLAAALETKSSHPIAASIISLFSGCITTRIEEYGAQVGLPDVKEFKNESGMGLSGTVDDKKVIVGNLALVEKFDIECDEESLQCHKSWQLSGCTVVFVAVENEVKLVLALADKCRSSSANAIRALNLENIESTMLTGDAKGPAHMIKQKIGLSNVVHSMKPEDKYEWILQTQNDKSGRSKYIAMIGDGVNDSPALAAANIGIAIGASATALAVESAGISLMSNDLVKIVDLIKLGRYCKKMIWQNIFGSMCIKLIFVIVAFTGNGMLWLAVLSDVLGLFFVSINGLRPLRWKNKRPANLTVSYNSVQINV